MIKKLFCLSLVFCLAFTAGCAETVEQISSQAEESDIVSSDASEDVSSVPETGSPSTEHTIAIDNLLSDNSDRTLSSSNLLSGLSYSVSREASPDYPDTDKLLTNGVVPTGFDKENWCGYYSPQKEDLSVTFDLGSVKDGILDFGTTVLYQPDYGIGICQSVTVSVAGEDGVYTVLGIAYPSLELASAEAWQFEIKLAGSVSARYIKFDYASPGAVWLFVGECRAVAYSSDYQNSPGDGMFTMQQYYGSTEITEPVAEKYWDSSESDYTDTINLVRGVKPSIFSSAAVTADIATDWYNSKNTGILTNGIKASKASYGDSSWFHNTHGGVRDYIFDLGCISSVEGFSVGALRDTTAGVNLPRNLTVLLSANGVDWMTAYSIENLGTGAEQEIIRIEESFNKKYKARFVKVSLNVNTHAYIDEITVTGTKKIGSSCKDIVPDEGSGSNSMFVNDYIYPEDFCDVHNMLLSYNCLTDDNVNHSAAGLNTVDWYLPHVAYLDTDGNIKDTLYDAYLYLPYTRFNYSDFGRSAKGWKMYIDNIYYEGKNMDALEECVGQVADELGLDDYYVKVFTPILYTFRTLDSGATNTFGDIDGDGKNEDFSNIKDRKKAIKWIIDESLKRFDENDYEYLKFCGFYWFEEHIAYDDPHEKELIAYASDYVHSLGYKLFWIPYRNASGYDEWKELGFDLACMQPNYMFHDDFTNRVLYDNADTTKLYGMCVEMEINDPANRIDASKYNEYIIAGVQTGYMKAVKIYYTAGIPGAIYKACYSSEAHCREVYDNTYLYAKEKYELAQLPDNLFPETPLEVTCKLNGSVDAVIEMTDHDITGIVIVNASPRYGSVRVNTDGSFTYFAPEGYIGSDKFEVCFNYGYGVSETYTVNITIE